MRVVSDGNQRKGLSFFCGTHLLLSVTVFADFDTYVAVYSGDSYWDLTCVSAGHFSYGGGKISFVAHNDTEFSILIGGSYEYAVGDYTLVVSVEDDCVDISNDSCDNAAVVDEESFPLSSSNMQASPSMQYDEFPGNCFLGFNWRTSWYKLQLSGSSETARCLRLSVDMESYGRVVLLSGTCEGPRCEEARDGYDSSFSLKVNADETYLLGVSGRERGSSFTVDLEEFDCVENDSCEAAASYSSFPVVEKTSPEFGIPATLDSPGHACRSFPRNSKGTWYRFEGTGGCVAVDVWGIGRSYIGVYSGDDSMSLSCVAEEPNTNATSKSRMRAG